MWTNRRNNQTKSSFKMRESAWHMMYIRNKRIDRNFTPGVSREQLDLSRWKKKKKLTKAFPPARRRRRRRRRHHTHVKLKKAFNANEPYSNSFRFPSANSISLKNGMSRTYFCTALYVWWDCSRPCHLFLFSLFCCCVSWNSSKFINFFNAWVLHHFFFFLSSWRDKIYFNFTVIRRCGTVYFFNDA